MKILAIETTELIGSLAAIRDGKPLYQLTLDASQRTSQSLAPGIKTVLAEAEWQPDEIDLLAVCRGPGSFTGLRIGITAAKTLAYAIGADILGVNTLEVIASATPDDIHSISAAIDAQRGEVVAQAFQRAGDGQFRATEEEVLVRVEDWFENIPADCHATGPILKRWASRAPNHVKLLDADLWYPTATALGLLTEKYHREGQRDDLWKLLPRYSRRSAAEEKWEQRTKGGGSD